MLVKPRAVFDRETEWAGLSRFVERRQRLAVVYGPRRVGKSFLLQALCEVSGGRHYQAITGAPRTQLEDFGRTLGGWLGTGSLLLDGWADALERLARLDSPVVVIDELPYLIETTPELPSLLQRYADSKDGPPLILAGSALSTMTDLVTARAPLYGRAAAVVVPAPFAGSDLAKLWRIEQPIRALWIDAAVGGLPGYRPLLEPPGADLDAWMGDEVLAASSPLLDAAEAALAETSPSATRGVPHTLLAAIAQGDRSFSGIARVAGQPTGALSRPLAALEAAGLITRVPDPLRSRRDLYDLADPHLRMWLTIVAPNRTSLQAGRAKEVWAGLRETTWPSQVMGPRWESVVRDHVARHAGDLVGTVNQIGVTSVSDRHDRTSHEVDVVAVRGRKVMAVGEAKLRRLGQADLERLRRIRELVDAPDARIILASVAGVDAAARDDDVVTILPRDVYR